MLKDNISRLRNVNGYSQEEVAEKLVFPGKPMQNGKREKRFPMWNVVRN